MERISVIDENWELLKNFFPDKWRDLAKKTGANTRLRGFDSVDNLMRTLLLHIAKGYSLRETVVRAKASQIANISDVALLKRLRKSEEWLSELCIRLLKETNLVIPTFPKQSNIRLVDATIVKEPGKTGSQWRIHYSFTIPKFKCDFFELTPVKGIGTGETFTRIPLSENDHIIGDRGYSTVNGIEYIQQNKAFSLVRVNTAALNIYKNDGKVFDLLKTLTELKSELQTGEWEVVLHGKVEKIEGRICAIKKSNTSAELTIKKLKREANKKGHKIKPATLEYAKYVILFTTFSKEKYKAAEILEIYRFRWQIELMFKRLKSLVQLGHLPKYDQESSKAWLYGKLFVGLLTEKVIQTAETKSPWGYDLKKK